jgi:hypothetical protein
MSLVTCPHCRRQLDYVVHRSADVSECPNCGKPFSYEADPRIDRRKATIPDRPMMRPAPSRIVFPSAGRMQRPR